MQDNQIYFNVKDNKVKVSYKHPVDIVTFLQVTQTAILSAMNQMVEAANDQDKAKQELYNLYNLVCSNTLDFFAPEISMRPDLTEDAILKAEDAILNGKA